MTLDQLTNTMNIFQIGPLVKVFLLVLGFFYFIFTIVVYRQISLMSQTVQTSVSGVVKLIALVQILLVLGLLLLTIILV